MKSANSKNRYKVAVCVLGIVAAITAIYVSVEAPGGNEEPTNAPDSGLPRDEQLAIQRAYKDDFEKRYLEWIDDFKIASIDLRTLPLAEMPISPAPPKNSLAQAIGSSDVIVEGVVSRLEYFSRQMRVTLRISDVVKGDPSDVSDDVSENNEITFLVLGGPYPTPDFSSGEYAYTSNIGPIFEGDQLIMLLSRPLEEHPPFPVDFFPQSFTGVYYIGGTGQVEPVRGNPFASDIEGLDKEEFKNLLRSIEP